MDSSKSKLKNQIQEATNNVIYTYVAHWNMVNSLKSRQSHIKIAQIILTVISTGGFITSLLAGIPCLNWVGGATSAIALALNLYSLDFKIPDNITLESARKEILMVFHKADLIIDCINNEIKESFPKFLENSKDTNLVDLTTKYYKWVTGGDFFEEKMFAVTTEFIKNHETILYNTTSSIKLITHKLIKFI